MCLDLATLLHENLAVSRSN